MSFANIRACAALVLSLLALGPNVYAADRPNVILVFTDDIGYGDISAFNPQQTFSTPHVDELVRRGMAFTRAYSTAAICAPSRYAVLTGNYVFRGRRADGTWAHCTPSQILENQDTLADVLRGEGYRTAFVGKLHLGAQFHRVEGDEPADLMRQADLTRPMFDGPIDHGFDTSVTLLAGIQNSPYAFFKDDRLARWNPESDQFDYFASNDEVWQHLKHNDSKLPEDRIKSVWDENYYMDNWETENVGPILIHQANRFIRESVADGDAPFYLHLVPEAAHSPYHPPVDLSPDDPDEHGTAGSRPVAHRTASPRSDMVVESDEMLGSIVATLEELGELENTLIIYTSDNGAARHRETWDDPKYLTFRYGPYGGNRYETGWEREGQIVNGQGLGHDGQPLRGSKGDIYEGGYRVPLVIAGGLGDGRRVPEGSTVPHVIGTHDLFATVCDALGVDVPEGQARDSVTFAGILTGDAPPEEHRRQFLLGQSNRASQTFEEHFAREQADKLGFTLDRDERGLIVGTSGAQALTLEQMDLWIGNQYVSRALYQQTDERLWKLLFMTDQQLPPGGPGGIERGAMELYELRGDPDESENLIDDPAHAERIESMLGHFDRIVDQGDRALEGAEAATRGGGRENNHEPGGHR